ncbi:MAG: PBSX family phage terminase large subunit [Stomatobaculum sp.]|nr:PBSX family phage terminase large subunit [Stomatobaculum sp.]MBR7058201.1 PBSX family phage terminase large subunit [Stomatobaculum sp.]
MLNRELTEREIDTLRWWRDWKATNNESFAPLIFDRHRFIVMKGGGGSGKSIFAGRYILERCTTEPGHRWLVVRKVARTLRESCFEQLKDQAMEYYADSIRYIPKGKSGDMYITLRNGSEIIFAGLDDVEKLKSIYNVTGIWIEEASEIDRGDFNQMNIRLRTPFPYHLTMLLSFNPISLTHWLKARFFDNPDPDALIHESTYRDNRYLPDEQRKVLEGYRNTDPYYYQVYCLGEWGVTGRTVFHAEQLGERLKVLRRQTPKTGTFDVTMAADGIRIQSWKFRETADGDITIFKAPETGRPYVIGGDTAGDGSDFFAGQVLDNITGEQVAVLHQRYDEDQYARQMYCLGLYYNTALLGIETNFSSYPVKLLEKMGYRKLYVREVEDEYTGRLRPSFGFRTDLRTRPVIIAGLVEALRDHARLINSSKTIEELLTFTRNQDGRAEAEHGAHDDLVMSLAIAWYIRPQQDMVMRVQDVARKNRWTADMWDDYRSASEEMQRMMIQQWGEPE